MNCKDIQDTLLENFGVFDISEDIKNHLRECESCRAYYSELENLHKRMGTDNTFKLDEHQITNITEQINEKIDTLEVEKETKATPMWKYFVPVAAGLVLVLGLALVGNLIHWFENGNGLAMNDDYTDSVMVVISQTDLEDYSGIEIDNILTEYSSQDDVVGEVLLIDDLTEEEYQYLEANLNIGDIL